MPMYSGACVMPFTEIDNTGHVLSWLGKKKKSMSLDWEYCVRELVIFTIENYHQEVD